MLCSFVFANYSKIDWILDEFREFLRQAIWKTSFAPSALLQFKGQISSYIQPILLLFARNNLQSVFFLRKQTATE